MGHIMLSTMKKIQAALGKLTLDKDGVDGKGLYIYGEAWDFGEVRTPLTFCFMLYLCHCVCVCVCVCSSCMCRTNICSCWSVCLSICLFVSLPARPSVFLCGGSCQPLLLGCLLCLLGCVPFVPVGVCVPFVPVGVRACCACGGVCLLGVCLLCLLGLGLLCLWGCVPFVPVGVCAFCACLNQLWWQVSSNQRGVNASQLNITGTGLGSFNDRFRDAVVGGSPFASPLFQGWVTGTSIASPPACLHH